MHTKMWEGPSTSPTPSARFQGGKNKTPKRTADFGHDSARHGCRGGRHVQPADLWQCQGVLRSSVTCVRCCCSNRPTSFIILVLFSLYVLDVKGSLNHLPLVVAGREFPGEVAFSQAPAGKTQSPGRALQELVWSLDNCRGPCGKWDNVQY